MKLSRIVAGAAIGLALSAIASTHHRLDFLIGNGRALDPAQLVVVAVDAIGNGLTTSPSTSVLQPGMGFPRFTIRDMVASQLALLDHLGVSRLRAVIGASWTTSPARARASGTSSAASGRSPSAS